MLDREELRALRLNVNIRIGIVDLIFFCTRFRLERVHDF
jgi:hypothetical protein